MRFGAVFRYYYRTSYGAVCWCDISYGAGRCGFEKEDYGAVRYGFFKIVKATVSFGTFMYLAVRFGTVPR